MIKTLLAAVGCATLATYLILTFVLTFGTGSDRLAESGLPWHFATFGLLVFFTTAFCLAVTSRVLWRQLNPRETLQSETERAVDRKSNRQTRHAGTMKFFNPVKGFGFATLEDGRDVFVHKSRLQHSSDQSSLKTGTKVTMQLIEEERGPAGTRIRISQEQGNDH